MSRILTKEERKEKFETKWPEWELIEFNGYYESCKVRHSCGCEKTYETYFNVEKRGPTCQNCIDTKKWYWNIGDRVGDLIIINRRARPNTLQEYQYKCEICGFDCSKAVYIKGEHQKEYWTTGHSIKGIQNNGGHGCACCGGRVVQPGINDVATTVPDVIEYFYDKTASNKWSKASQHKEKIICPTCGTVQPNEIQIGNLVYEGFNCINCGNNISYPEKMMYFLLKEIDVDFKMHKTFEWSKSVYDECDGQFHKREYDFYIPSVNTIVEMHGSQHYRNTFSWEFCNEQVDDSENRRRIDTVKQQLAESHGYNYIIIDCRDSTKEYIKRNILKSELVNIFNLNNINWNKVSRKALNGIAKLIVTDKEKHPTKTSPELADEYGVSLSSVLRWLKNANLYDQQFENENAGIKRSYPVYSPILNKAFRTVKEAAQEIGIGVRSLYAAVNHTNNQKHAGRHPVTGERLTWERWTLEQYEEWCTLHNYTPQ